MTLRPLSNGWNQSIPDDLFFPDDRALRFVALLLEDYADEWLWRPAMWWRWVPAVSRVALGRKIAGSMLSKWLSIPLGFYFGKRQLREWLWNDGVDQQNSDAVRDMYYHELDFLEALLSQQPYLLGNQPSAADFGYFGPMFRHFGNDPDSSEVMRRYGPKTYEWLARLWNARESFMSETSRWTWPDAWYWQPLLKRIANDYLPYLHQNAVAFAEGRKRFDYSGESLSFKSTVTTHYRVWCRENLQEEYNTLDSNAKNRLNDLFEAVGGLQSLHADAHIASGLKEQFVLPISPLSSKPPLSIKRTLMGQPRN